MHNALPLLPAEAETIADLRDLYRASEARAARLRLLSATGQSLAVASADTVDACLEKCVRDLALFLGRPSGVIVRRPKDDPAGFPVAAPGDPARVLARIVIADLASLDAITDREDRDTCRLCLDLIGAALDRTAREAERTALLSALSEREQRLENLLGSMFMAQEDERRRLSHELHDGVAQTATALVRLIEGVGGQGAPGISPDERGELARIGRGLVTELRAVIGGLRPPLLDDLGLPAALRALADGLAAQGFAVTVEIDEGGPRLAPHIESALFRVAQEALTNVQKHAGGLCRVTVRLALADPQRRTMQISDEGCGMAGLPDARPGQQTGRHIGIDVMRERMSAIGGALELSGGVTGTTITAILPAELGL